MAIESKQISVGELDFDQIKTNLKEYLRGQAEFSDYDFDGSGLSVLLDVLAYNTHYNALYNNFAINELFLDTATKRSSVVSRAGELGYVPHSATCSQALINITVSNTTTAIPPTAITIPKQTPFGVNVNSTGYTFYTTEDITAVNNGSNVYLFENVLIKEGSPLTYRYTATPGMRYLIPNANADLSTLAVRVQDSSSSSNFRTFNRSDTILNITSTDNVYFVKEIENRLYEITFGDGVIGSALSNGNIVHLDYFVTSENPPNGARTFTYNGSSLYGGTISLTTVTPAFNGGGVEDIESIKYNAPKHYSAQNRAVTSEDYKTLIYSQFPDAQAVSVWGGEYNNPPVYGKTFICVKPKNAEALTPTQESYIKTEILSPRSIVSITPEFVKPEYFRLGLEVSVYFNYKETTRSVEAIKTLVQQVISDYNSADLMKFEGIFRNSKLTRLIDTCEPSIVSSVINSVIRIKIEPKYNVSANYVLNIINPIYTEGVPEKALSSTGFYIYGQPQIHYLEDDGVGNIKLYHKTSSGSTETIKIADPAIGSIDYNNGVINIKNLNITAIVGNELLLTLKPESSDIVSAYTQMAVIDFNNLSINVIADKTASGDVGGGKNFIFTSTAK